MFVYVYAFTPYNLCNFRLFMPFTNIHSPNSIIVYFLISLAIVLCRVTLVAGPRVLHTVAESTCTLQSKKGILVVKKTTTKRKACI